MKKPDHFPRRKFLLQLSALSPVLVYALRGHLLGGVALAQTPAATASPVALDCVASPSMTEGPYFVDEKLNRSDIRTDPTDNSVKPGIPLKLAMAIFSVNSNTCTPIEGAQIDVWHCDAAGLYSDEAANNTIGKKFLRGYQLTDGSGLVNFTTIYPGWYQGRTVHIHVKVRIVWDDGRQTYAFNSQIFFDDALTDQIYTQPPYNARGKRSTRNADDMIFKGTDPGAAGSDDVGEKMLITLTKDGDGYAGRINIGVDLSKPSDTSFSGPGGAPPPAGGPPRQ